MLRERHGSTITGTYHANLIGKVREAVKEKRRGKLRRGVLQSVAWKHACSPPPRTFRVVASARKVMATVFWDAEGTVLTDYLEYDSNITGT